MALKPLLPVYYFWNRRQFAKGSLFIIKYIKKYNLEIATKNAKLFGFVRTDHLRTKIIINDETIEQ